MKQKNTRKGMEGNDTLSRNGFGFSKINNHRQTAHTGLSTGNSLIALPHIYFRNSYCWILQVVEWVEAVFVMAMTVTSNLTMTVLLRT